MYCEKDTIVQLCEKSYKEILDFEKQIEEKLTFFLQKNGYVATHLPKCNGDLLYIHQIITGCYGNGKGTSDISVDHIDRNPLNNSINNLRWATPSENGMNKSILKRNKSTKTGVYYDKHINRWLVKMYINGIQKHIGNYLNF
jgi:hypothetical protein